MEEYMLNAQNVDLYTYMILEIWINRLFLPSLILDGN